jgi:tetratricopeptide (TPR) repeat protein
VIDTASMEPAVAELLGSLRDAVVAAPSDARRWASLGAALDAHQMLAEAEVCLAAAVARDPRGFEHVYEHAIVGALLGAPIDDVVRRFDDALALRPDYAPAHVRRGEALLAAGRVDDALLSFGRALAVAPGFERATLARGRALLAAERGADAVAALEPLAARHADSREVQAVFVQALFVAGLGERAESLAERLPTLEERALPQQDPARAAVMELTATTAARHQRARRALERGEVAAATRLLEDLVASQPGEARFHLELANLYVRAARPSDATRALERVLAREPDHAGALALMGQLDVDAGRHAAGLARLDRAAARGPLDLASRHARASALGHLGRWSEAAGAFLDAAKVAPQPAEFHLLAGLALCEAGRFDEAREQLEVSRAQGPEHPLARTLAARLPAR